MATEPDRRDRPAQEPWDLERFIALYHEVVDQQGGWGFERNEAHVRDVESSYRASGTATLAEHARDRFRFEQRH